MPTPSPSEPWIEAGREAGLLLAAQRGDRDSFYELFRDHQRALFAVCFVFTLDEDAAVRLMQGSARLAWRGIRQLPVGRPFFPFVVRIAQNLAVADARRRHDEWRGRRFIPRTGGTVAVADAEERAALEAFLSLTEDEKLLVVLRLVLRMDYVQVARVLDATVGSVMHRLQALRGRLEDAPPAEAA